MPEIVRITLYNILNCGYYDSANPAPSLGGLVDTFQDLLEWGINSELELVRTKTFDLEPGQDGNTTYLFDMASNASSQDFLIATWNEVPSHEGYFASVDGDLAANDATVHMTEFPPNTIPGFSSYFWVMPAESLIATLSMGQRSNGLQNFRKYVTCFLERFSRYVIHEALDDDDIQIRGYGIDGEILNVQPRFTIKQSRKPGSIAYIRDNRNNIRKVVKKAKIQHDHEENINAVWRLLRNIGIGQPPPNLEQEMFFKYELNYQPTDAELRMIITDWQERLSDTQSDIGFIFTGEHKTHWLSHSIARNDFEFDLWRLNPEKVEINSFLEVLSDNKMQILESLTAY